MLHFLPSITAFEDEMNLNSATNSIASAVISPVNVENAPIVNSTVFIYP